MIKTLFHYSLGFITLILALVQTCEDIPAFDYPSHPEQPFDFEHLDLNITLEPELTLVRGVASYTVIPKIDGLTELVLLTEESAIDGVSINQTDADYELNHEKLVIFLQDSSVKGEEFEIAVTWQSNSSFGLYLDSEGNFWSSKNPLAHRHWFPVFDHPRNELTFEAHISIPYDSEVLFNGTLTDDEVEPGNSKKIHYASETPVPVTGISFAMGDFLISEVASGLTTVRLFSSEQRYTEEERASLIREASQLKKQVEQTLSMEYPWEGLNIVILPDNFWEERTHGAGTIFLYENLGSLSVQLKRGMYAQWFGEYLRTEQFFDFDRAGDELMRTALHFSLNENSELIENPDSLNIIYSWNHWQESFKSEPELFQETITSSLPDFVRSMEGTISFDDYADAWYEETGLSWHDITHGEVAPSNKKEIEEVNYSLNVTYDEVNSSLDLIFELTSGGGEELYSLTMTEYTFDDSIAHEVNFTGSSDTASFELSPSAEYISFSGGSVSMESIEITGIPLFFLLNQLRSSDAKEREVAASLLSGYSDNLDLQLALNDVLSTENNPSVKAALLNSLAEITNGATGTEQQFLDGLNSNEVEVQKASLKALANYPENDIVKNALRNSVLRASSEELFKTGLESYAVVSTGDELVSLTRRLQRVDSTGLNSLIVMNLYPDADSTNTYLTIAEEYLSSSYAYITRKQALQFLLTYDSSQENWIERLKVLLDDRDPRIRYVSLKAVQWLSPSEAFKILSSVEDSEFDVRVLVQVDNLLEQLSD